MRTPLTAQYLTKKASTAWEEVRAKEYFLRKLNLIFSFPDCKVKIRANRIIVEPSKEMCATFWDDPQLVFTKNSIVAAGSSPGLADPIAEGAKADVEIRSLEVLKTELAMSYFVLTKFFLIM